MAGNGHDGDGGDNHKELASELHAEPDEGGRRSAEAGRAWWRIFLFDHLWKYPLLFVALVGAGYAADLAREDREHRKEARICRESGTTANGPDPAPSILVFKLRNDLGSSTGHVADEVGHLARPAHSTGAQSRAGFDAIPVCEEKTDAEILAELDRRNALGGIVGERMPNRQTRLTFVRRDGHRADLGVMPEGAWTDVDALQTQIFEAMHARGGGWHGIWGAPEAITSARYRAVRIHAESSIRMAGARLFDKGEKRKMLVAGAFYALGRRQEAHETLEAVECSPLDANRKPTSDEMRLWTEIGVVKAQIVADAAEPDRAPLRAAARNCLLASLANDGDSERRELAVFHLAQLLRDTPERARNLQELEADIDRIVPELQGLAEQTGDWRTAGRMTRLTEDLLRRRGEIVQRRGEMLQRRHEFVRKLRTFVQRRRAIIRATAVGGARINDAPPLSPEMSRMRNAAMGAAAIRSVRPAPEAKVRGEAMQVTVRGSRFAGPPRVGRLTQHKSEHCRFWKYDPVRDSWTRAGTRRCS